METVGLARADPTVSNFIQVVPGRGLCPAMGTLWLLLCCGGGEVFVSLLCRVREVRSG